MKMLIASFNGREVKERRKIQRSMIRTEDGTVIITDPELGQSVSGRTKEEADAEIARRKMGRAA